MYKYCRYTKNY